MKIQLLNITDMLKNKTFIAVFINCLLIPVNAGTMLSKEWIDYLLMIHSVQLLKSVIEHSTDNIFCYNLLIF